MCQSHFVTLFKQAKHDHMKTFTIICISGEQGYNKWIPTGRGLPDVLS